MVAISQEVSWCLVVVPMVRLVGGWMNDWVVVWYVMAAVVVLNVVMANAMVVSK